MSKNNQDEHIEIYDPEWIKVIAEALLDIKINELSNSQKKMLKDSYLENLRLGLKPKEAIDEALKITLCFKK